MAKKKAPSAKKALTKSQIYATIAEKTDLARKDVKAVFDELAALTGKSLKRSGPGSITIPGLAKVTTRRKPATKARKGINPFTGEETMFKAKPASTVVKIRPLKALKDMVN